MTHRAETIMAAVVSTLTGLTTTGARVYRGRAYPIPKADANALVIFQGSDEIQDGSMFWRVQSLLTVNIEAVAREATAQIDETLNLIRTEVATAIGASTNLGLAFEIGALEQQAEQPEISDDGDRPTGRMRIVLGIQYMRDRLNPALPEINVFSDEFSAEFA